MANIITGPAPVPVDINVAPIGPLDRAPAPVSPAVDPALSQINLDAVIPVTEAIETVNIANTVSGNGNVIVAQPAYLTVLEDGTLAARQVTTLNFIGNVSIEAGKNTANITIVGGGGGNSGNYSNSNVAAFLAAFGANSINTTGNIAAGNAAITNLVASDEIFAVTGSFAGDTNTGDGALYVGSPTFTSLGTDVMAQFTGNVFNYGQINFQNYSNSPTSTGDYIVTADNGNDTTHYIDMGITGGNWNGTQENSLGTALSAGDGYLYVQDGNLALGVKDGVDQHVWYYDNTGNLTVPGSIILPPGALITSNGASPSPSLSGFTSVDAMDITAADNITGGNVRALNNVYVEAANGNLVLGDATATSSPGLSSTNSITFTANRAGATKEMVFGTNGTLYTPGNIGAQGVIQTGVFNLSTLPSAAAAGVGARAFVTDADSTTFGAAYSGDSGNAMPVWSNGTSWFIG